MSHDVLVAKHQAWCTTLLSVITDAYKLGAVIGAAPLVLPDRSTIFAHVLFVPGELSKIVRRDDIRPAEFGPALVVDIVTGAIPEAARSLRLASFGAAHVLEVWQIDAERNSAQFFQARADWGYDLVQPDKSGIYFSAAAEELAFPATWFRQQPSLFDIMAWWGMIDD